MKSFTSLKLRSAWMPAGGGAGADGDQDLRMPDLVDPFGVVRRRDRAFDERQVVRAFDHRPRGLGEIGDLDRAGHGQQFVFAVQQD